MNKEVLLNCEYSLNTTQIFGALCSKKCLTKRSAEKKTTKWYNLENIPLAIVNVSIIQIFFHVYSTKKITKVLIYDPNRPYEAWRFMTYMLIHDDWSHLTLNIVIQCIFASLLEKRQGAVRILALYILGGITGVLGAACLHPHLVIGASAGGYSLLCSNLADIMLNYETISYKYHQVVSVATILIFDVIYDVVHACFRREPQVSWQAHFVGGLAGIFLGFVFFKCHTNNSLTIHKHLFWTSILLYCAMVISFIVITIHIGKCTPTNVIRSKYIYFC
ncbi:protein rhomboid [Cylas formicarius]|uniref:protein rhomboid n=1 Tax=Cylas formicarius TaxID=197179 RepID=UPI00295860CF|nr:protein rhomboid [Cylas formicarius]